MTIDEHVVLWKLQNPVANEMIDKGIEFYRTTGKPASLFTVSLQTYHRLLLESESSLMTTTASNEKKFYGVDLFVDSSFGLDEEHISVS